MPLEDLAEGLPVREEEREQCRVELRARPLGHEFERALEAEGRLVDAAGHQRIEHVGQADDAPLDRDRVAGQAVRIAAAVPALVVGQRDLRTEPKHRARGMRQQVVPVTGVFLHHVELLRREPAGLVEDRVADRDLADVVQRRGRLDQVDLLGRQPDQGREQARVRRDPPDVLAGFLRPQLDRLAQLAERLALRVEDFPPQAGIGGIEPVPFGEQVQQPHPVRLERPRQTDADRAATADWPRHREPDGVIVHLEAVLGEQRRHLAGEPGRLGMVELPPCESAVLARGGADRRRPAVTGRRLPDQQRRGRVRQHLQQMSEHAVEEAVGLDRVVGRTDGPDDRLQPGRGLLQRLQRLVRPQRGVDRGVQAVGGQLGLVAVVVDLEVLDDLTLGRRAGVAGPQDDPRHRQSEARPHVPHQLEPCLVVLHHHVDERHRDVRMLLEQRAGLRGGVRAEQAQRTAVELHALEHHPGHVVQALLVVHDQYGPRLRGGLNENGGFGACELVHRLRLMQES